MKVISFCLYGTNEKYTKGAIENAKLALSLFPDFHCFFYYEDGVPSSIMEELSFFPNVILIDMTTSPLPPMMWRFLAIDHPQADLFLSRDTDSRLSKREKILIDIWLLRDSNFISIKDHPIHHNGTKILGGMWGMKKIKNFNIEKLMSDWCSLNNVGREKTWNLDQIFLNDIIFPISKNSLSYFDDYNNDNLFNCEGIPIKRKNWEFIGEVFDHKGARDYHYKSLRGFHYRSKGLIGRVIAKIYSIFSPEWK